MASFGFDWRPLVHSSDEAERLVEMAVAERAAEYVARDRQQERKNLATEVGNNVGQIVSGALRNLARAMR